MIKMVLKKIWKQRRGNRWLIIESFIVFILFCLFFDPSWSMFIAELKYPNGYTIENVYSLKLAEDKSIKTGESTQESIRRIIQQIEKHHAVEAVTTYFGSEHLGQADQLPLKKDSIFSVISFFSTDEHYFDVFKVEIEEDGGIFPWKTENGKSKIIFTQSVSKYYFGNKNPIKKMIGEVEWRTSKPICSHRISGLIKRQQTDSHHASGIRFCYTTLPENYKYDLNTSIAFRIKDGISYEQFENKEMDHFKELLSAGAIYPKSILSLKKMKEEKSKINMRVLNILVLTLLFFTFNLFISMFASFHFRIKKRKEEIGLKLAIGASKQAIMKELIFEGVIILTLAAIPASIFLANLYYIDFVFLTLKPIRFLNSLGYISITYTFLVIIVSLGTWLPARRVMKIEPAIALKEE